MAGSLASFDVLVNVAEISVRRLGRGWLSTTDDRRPTQDEQRTKNQERGPCRSFRSVPPVFDRSVSEQSAGGGGDVGLSHQRFADKDRFDAAGAETEHVVSGSDPALADQ